MERIMLVSISIGTSAILAIPFIYLTWFLFGTNGDVRPEKFKNLDQEVWLQFHQGSWGGEAYEMLTIGQGYFFGLMHREDAHLKVSFFDEEPWKDADKYDIPSGVDVVDCIFWEKKHLLFDMENKICYSLKPKKKITLTAEEKDCKESFEKEWNAKIFIEKGFCSIEPIFALPNVIYVTVDFKQSDKTTSFTNTDVEQLAFDFSKQLSAQLKDRNSYDTIMVYFENHDDREMYEFDYKSKYKYARYDTGKNKVVSYQRDVDFIKKLYVKWASFSVITYEGGRNDEQKVWAQKLGCELHHIADDFSLKYIGREEYKGLNCKVFVAKHPEKLTTPNGYLTCECTYLFYNETLVEARVNYRGYPKNEKFNYKEVVSKIAYEYDGNDPEKAYYKFVDTKYLNFKSSYAGTMISCHADTTHLPWKIDCMASITAPEFVYLYK